MTSPVPRPTGGQLNQRIAHAVVRARKGLLGRGPTKAQAFFRHNFVVVVMEDALTGGERRLAAGGERDAVLRMRQRYQRVLHAELVGAIEELTAGKVQASMSGNHIDPDLAVELFVLDRLCRASLRIPPEPALDIWAARPSWAAMPYVRCPRCRLISFSVARWSHVDRCSRCDENLPRPSWDELDDGRRPAYLAPRARTKEDRHDRAGRDHHAVAT